MATFARSSMRLTAYAGALTNLAAQAAERHVTPEDRQLLDPLLLAITELLWKQSTRAALSTPRLGGHHGRRLRSLHHTRWLYSRALRAPTRRRRPSSHPAHAPSHPSRHSSGDYRLAQQGGNRTYGRSPATLSVADLSRPQALGEFPLDPQSHRINRYIGSAHFGMETLASILPYLNPGDWTVSIDLKDAYHHVPIAAASRDLLGFTFNGSVYHFKALPFGLKPAPRLFKRLVGCGAAFLRQRGVANFLLPRHAGSQLAPPPPPRYGSTWPSCYRQCRP